MSCLIDLSGYLLPSDASNLIILRIQLTLVFNISLSLQIGWSRSVLADSVNAYPCNWRAWLDLASVCVDFDSVRQLKLQEHWMREFFMAHVFLELQQTQE